MTWPSVASRAIGLCAALLASSGFGRPPTAPVGPTLHERFGSLPFVTPLPQVGPLRSGKGTLGVTAAECGACHVEVYREWRASTHSAALEDLQYEAELAKPDSPRWLCLSCHTPVQNQRPVLITPETHLTSAGDDVRHIDARTNPGFDPKMRAEAITCATCHVRLEPDGGTVVIGPRGGPAPHPVREGRAALDGVCVRCHSPGPVRLTSTFFCWFETAEELAAGPYAATHSCVDCHMPGIERPIATGSPPRKTHRHTWEGGGVPKHYDSYDGLLERGYTPGLGVTVGPLPALHVGAPLELDLTLENARAGHALPTGDPERRLMIRARLEDSAGDTLASDQLQLGQTWDYGDATRPSKRLTDNRLRPRERRSWRPRLALPMSIEGVTLVVEALEVRLEPKYARAMRGTQLDDELEQLAPGSRVLLRQLSQHYPLYTEVFRQEISLASGAVRTFTLAELLRRSQAARDRSLDEVERYLQLH